MQPEEQQQDNQPQVIDQAPVQQVVGEQMPPQIAGDGQVQPVPVEPGNSTPGEGGKPTDKLKGLMPKLVKILLIVFVAIGALFFINLFAPRAIQILKENNPLMTPTPEPTPTSTPVVNFPPSKYASDPEVIQIEDQLSRLEKGLNEIEFSDDTLHPPLLDWEISFEK